MRKIKRILAMMLSVILLASVFAGSTEAASYPSLNFTAVAPRVVEGQSLVLEFRFIRVYNSEKYYINIYEGLYAKPEKLVGKTSGSASGYQTGDTIKINVDTKALNMKPGTYLVETYMEFYTQYAWHTTPTTIESYIVVVENVCGGKHTFDGGKLNRNPSCVLGATKTYKCQKCKFEKTESIPALGHSYDKGSVTTEPKCTRIGIRTHVCTRCGSTKKEEIPRLGHDYDEGIVQIQPTCQREGKRKRTCRRCGLYTIETMPKEHVWSTVKILEAPTVSEKGLRDCRCTVCQSTRRMEMPPIFSDVYNDWYTSYVQYVYDESLMTGIKGTTKFEPLGNITKAQVAQVLYNVNGKAPIRDVSVFYDLKDVYNTEWYADAVAWAYYTGIVTGDLNTKKFSPNANVTREQLALMMFRYAGYKNYNTEKRASLAGLKNQENVSNWSKTAVEWAVGAELISGVEKNGVKDLQPQGSATRAQMAAILMRFDEKVIHAPTPTPTPKPTATPTPTTAPTPTATPTPIPDKRQEKARELARHIKENGVTVETNEGDFKQLAGWIDNPYEHEGEELTTRYDISITYIEDKGILYFEYKWNDTFKEWLIDEKAGFEYDIETGETSEVLYCDYSEGTRAVLQSKGFDISTFNYDTTLDFEVLEKLNTQESDEIFIQSANLSAKFVVLLSQQLLNSEGYSMEDLGFIPFKAAAYSMGLLQEIQ